MDKKRSTHVRSNLGWNVLRLLVPARVALGAFFVLTLAFGAFLVVFLVSIGFLAPLK
jgi:hypothetical protein